MRRDDRTHHIMSPTTITFAQIVNYYNTAATLQDNHCHNEEFGTAWTGDDEGGVGHRAHPLK